MTWYRGRPEGWTHDCEQHEIIIKLKLLDSNAEQALKGPEEDEEDGNGEESEGFDVEFVCCRKGGGRGPLRCGWHSDVSVDEVV